MSLAFKLVLSPLLVAQAMRTRARLPRLEEAAGERHGVAGDGPLLRLLVTGDSSAAGVGVVHQREALAGQLAPMVAAQCGAQVQWRLVARSGLTTAQTLHLLQREHLPHFDLAVVLTGVNDVIDQVPSHHAVSARDGLANWLRNALGVHHVVFAPLPPVHHFPGLPQPLRWVAGADARRHNLALQHWARTREDVSQAEMDLKLNRGVMASDGFHPGERAYRQVAHDLARHLARQVLHVPVADEPASADGTAAAPPTRAKPASAFSMIEAAAAPPAPEMALCIDRHELARARASAHPLNRPAR